MHLLTKNIDRKNKEGNGMDMFMQNLLYSLLLIVSGVIIFAALTHLRMKVARACFAALFAVMLVYIPFYFGGKAMIAFCSYVIKDAASAEIFVNYMQDTLTAPFWLFQSMTLGMTLFSVIIIIAALIAAVTITVEVVKYIKKCWNNSNLRHQDDVAALLPVLYYIRNFRFLYKRLERYRN